MTVKNLYPEQFEELRSKLFFTYNEDDLDCIGAITDTWTDEEWENWSNGVITDDMTVKAFDVYDFGCDDSFCTAMMYEEFPDKD